MSFSSRITLQDGLNATRGVVVFLTNNQRIQLTAGGVQRVNGRVDTQDAIPDGSVPRLHLCAKVVAGDGSVKSSAGTYTARTEVIEPVLREAIRSRRTPICQSRLITYRGRHTAQQCGYFRTGRGVTIDTSTNSSTSRPSSRTISPPWSDRSMQRADGFPAARSSGHTPDTLSITLSRHFVVEVSYPHEYVPLRPQTQSKLGVLDRDVTDKLHHVYGFTYTHHRTDRLYRPSRTDTSGR